MRIYKKCLKAWKMFQESDEFPEEIPGECLNSDR